MLRLILWATVAVATVFASGDFAVLYSPENVVFSGKLEINQSSLKDVFTTVLGFTTKSGMNWSGIRTSPPFNLPKAVVVIAVEGIQHLESRNGIIFPLNDDEMEETTWHSVSRTLEERSVDNKVVRMRLADGLNALGNSALGILKPTPIDESTLNSLSLKNDEDRKILEEIKLLDAIAKNPPSDLPANGKKLYWLVVSGMRSLIEFHGKDSAAVKEALAFLNDALDNVTEAFVAGFKNKVVIAAFTNGASKTRNTRAINLSRERREEPKQNEEPKLAKRYNENYPVIFNIFLWFGVVFFFSLLAICITIADMDPGRDSIIYRMTSTRMKKDN